MFATMEEALENYKTEIRFVREGIGLKRPDCGAFAYTLGAEVSPKPAHRDIDDFIEKRCGGESFRRKLREFWAMKKALGLTDDEAGKIHREIAGLDP